MSTQELNQDAFGPPPSRHWTAKSPAEAALARWYPQLLRGPRHSVWRGVLAILLAVVAGAFAAVLVGTLAFGILLAQGAIDLQAAAQMSAQELTAEIIDEPVMFLANNLMLASLIPISMLSMWACFWWRPRWMSSVAGGIRWTWLGLTFLISLPVYALLSGIGVLLSGPVTWRLDATAVTLLVIVLLTTPLQAAGEEYLFRGLITQSIGSWIARPLAAVLVSGLISGLGFAALHSVGADQDVWLFLGRFLYGLAFSYLTWQTGGLEAAISVHTVNNIAAMVPAIITGGLGAAVTAGEGSYTDTGVSVLVMVLTTALITYAGRRIGLQTKHDPAAQPGGPGPGRTDCWPPVQAPPSV